MNWRKLGLIYAPGGKFGWAQKYAMPPTADVIDDGRTIRVYFAALDDEQYGRVGYVDLDAADPTRILCESREPVLDLGELGTFDDSGVNPSCILNVGGEKYFYYIGWQRAERVPYMLFAGLATGNGRKFVKLSRVSMLDRTDAEPFSRTAPCVILENGLFKMWYWSCTNWTHTGDLLHYNNVIRYLESSDGKTWNGVGEICLAPDAPGDYSIGRPWVVRDADVYRMWYSIRSSTVETPYRIGYAESTDGRAWTRKDDEAGIAPSESGWDSEMVCYPCVVDAAGKRYMFYNGNRHGSTGFGCAVLES